MDSHIIFAVFPYLRTSKRVPIRGIELRSNRDPAGLPPEIQTALAAICQMFFLSDGVRIDEMTCAWLTLPDDKAERDRKLRHLREAQLLIGYLYSTPQPFGDVFLSFEHASLFVFHPKPVSSYLVWPGSDQEDRVTQLTARERPAMESIEGYETIRNGNVYLWVAEGSRIYPELPHITLNLSQYLDMNLWELLSREHNWALRNLYASDADFDAISETRTRLFVALEWYLRSCRATIGDAEALVHLAIALESLLRVRPGDRLTERFKDAVITILGPVPRLDSWLEQFYKARSKAVHEGVPHDLMFYAADQETIKKRGKEADQLIAHRPLIEYGRRIFRLCLTSIFSAATNAQTIGLSQLFVHNQERIENICKQLSGKKGPAARRLKAVQGMISELREFESQITGPDVPLDKVVGTARQLMQTFKESKPALSEEAEKALDKFISGNKANLMDQLQNLHEIAALLREVQRTQPPLTGFYSVVLMFIDYAIQPGFKGGAAAFEDGRP